LRWLIKLYTFQFDLDRHSKCAIVLYSQAIDQLSAMRTYDSFSEQELVEMLQAGDEAAFTSIYNRYWEKLIATAYFFTRNTQTAEDIVHDVMLSLWHRRDGIVIQSLQAYLATAVRFAVFKSIARHRHTSEITDETTVSVAQESVEEKLDAKFEEEFLRGVVERLPEKARLVFQYRREQHLSVKEVANKMEVSEKSIEYHMTRALKMIKQAFKKIKILFV
jgi:RNA polymerase sigma-70 factor (family 1)